MILGMLDIRLKGGFVCLVSTDKDGDRIITPAEELINPFPILRAPERVVDGVRLQPFRRARRAEIPVGKGCPERARQ